MPMPIFAPKDITSELINSIAETTRRMIIEAAGHGDLLELSPWDNLSAPSKEKWLSISRQVLSEVTG